MKQINQLVYKICYMLFIMLFIMAFFTRSEVYRIGTIIISLNILLFGIKYHIEEIKERLKKGL